MKPIYTWADGDALALHAEAVKRLGGLNAVRIELHPDIGVFYRREGDPHDTMDRYQAMLAGDITSKALEEDGIIGPLNDVFTCPPHCK